MRVLLVLVLLAGCSGAPPGAPEAPVHAAPEPEPMDDVRGTIERSGVYDRMCTVITGHGQALATATSLGFDVPVNATTVHVEAAWAAPNPTLEVLDFIVQDGQHQVAFGGPSPASAEYAADRLNGTHYVQVAPPGCRGAAHAGVYHDLTVDVVVRFR